MRIAFPFLALALAGCFGGSKPPPTLLTLTPSAAETAINAAAAAGSAITVDVPVTSREIRQIRVPVLEAPGQVTYVKGLQYVETPDRLFQQLLSETIRRTTGRVVLDPAQNGLDPGLRVSGQLQRFGYDAASGTVIVTYDATVSSGARVGTRRFTASAPADGTPATTGPALNRAANEVAQAAAAWIAG